jgi:alpha/beta hydrolase family protein
MTRTGPVFGCGAMLALAICFIPAAPAQARITKVQITTRETPTFGGFSWPGVGQYEKIAGKAFAEVDPTDPLNAVIVDIGLAPRNANGNVEFSFDFYILKPIDLSKGNHQVMYEPPNRGGKTWTALARVTGGGNDPGSITSATVLANSFLMPRGFTMVWSGWDFAAGTSTANNNTTITLPIAKNKDGSSITGPAFEYIVSPGASYTLNYPAGTLDQSQATLTHRVHLGDPRTVVPASGWTYDATGTAISLVGGNFVANDIYEFSYTARDPTVNGLGFAAIRDWVSWLRYEALDNPTDKTPNPLANYITRVYTEISSQPGRLLNDFRHLGFNQALNGMKVFDGMMQWIAAGDGINMNYRFSQPGRTERNRQDHLFVEGVFPFANVTTTDPLTGKTDSRYARCTATGTCPLGAEIYSANEYWVKAASLLHTTADGKTDLPESPYTRNYFISSHQHGTGSRTNKGNCQQFQNPLNSAPVQRALFLALDQWSNGIPPPASRVPRLADGTLVPPLPRSGMGFPSIPNVTYTGLKTTRYLFNYGPNFYETGIATINPPAIAPGDLNHPQDTYQDNPLNGPIYPSFIPLTDSDGNDIAGVRLPDVTVPVATYTGWALRSGPQANDGCESSGQFIAFAPTGAAKAGDPRKAVSERYPTFNDYYAKAVAAIDDLVKHRLVLCEDATNELARMIQLGLDFGVPAGTAPNPLPGFRCETSPTARCRSVTVSADAASCRAAASIDNGSSDADGDSVALAQSPAGPFGLGSTLASLTATDPSGNASNTCSGTVTVVDRTPPGISRMTASPNVLWPPNHKMVAVSLGVSVADACDANVASSCRIVSVSSNEGSAADSQITGRMTANLRAERSGKGARVYNVAVTCTDASNNGSTGTVAVTVPHDQGN